MWIGLAMRCLAGPALRCAAPRAVMARASPLTTPQLRLAAHAAGFRLQQAALPGAALLATQANRPRSVAAQSYQFEAAPGERMGMGGEPVVGEVDFDPALNNSVTLMGNVGAKPELRFLETGTKLTNLAIALWDKKGESQWVDIEVWGPLAESVVSDVQKGQKVAVSGRLKVSSWTDKNGERKKAYKVMASTVNRVRGMGVGEGGGGYSGGGGYGQQQQQQQQQQQSDWGSPAPPPQQQQQAPHDYASPGPAQGQAAAAAASSALTTAEEQWMSFFEDPSGWYDNRPSKATGKINARSPDFKRKDGGRDSPALWIDSKSTPAWVRGELSKVDNGAGQQGYSAPPPF